MFSSDRLIKNTIGTSENNYLQGKINFITLTRVCAYVGFAYFLWASATQFHTELNDARETDEQFNQQNDALDLNLTKQSVRIYSQFPDYCNNQFDQMANCNEDADNTKQIAHALSSEEVSIAMAWVFIAAGIIDVATSIHYPEKTVKEAMQRSQLALMTTVSLGLATGGILSLSLIINRYMPRDSELCDYFLDQCAPYCDEQTGGHGDTVCTLSFNSTNDGSAQEEMCQGMDDAARTWPYPTYATILAGAAACFSLGSPLGYFTSKYRSKLLTTTNDEARSIGQSNERAEINGGQGAGVHTPLLAGP
jgi:hypothetical protein